MGSRFLISCLIMISAATQADELPKCSLRIDSNFRNIQPEKIEGAVKVRSGELNIGVTTVEADCFTLFKVIGAPDADMKCREWIESYSSKDMLMKLQQTCLDKNSRMLVFKHAMQFDREGKTVVRGW